MDRLLDGLFVTYISLDVGSDIPGGVKGDY